MAVVLVVCLIGGCTQHDRYTTVSKPFGLCAKETKGITYHLESGIDAQRGTIQNGSTAIRVYIDTYPDIQLSQRQRVKQQPAGFTLFTDEKSTDGGEQKMYTYKQYNEYVFVQLKFDSRNAKQIALADMMSRAFAPCNASG